MQSTPTHRSGLVTFAGVLAIIIGAINAISGLAAITDDDELEKQAKEVLFSIDLSLWGWVWLILGVLQVVVGGLIIQRHPFGLLAGVGWAVISATLTAFVIFTYPLYAVIVIGLDVLVIWALLANADEFA